MPIRIQRSRAKGWTLPPNTVCVTRPGKWGNPYKVGDFAVPVSERLVSGTSIRIKSAAHAVALYRTFVRGMEPVIRAELAGKNLACWCPVGSACHADVLLEIANKEVGHVHDRADAGGDPAGDRPQPG